MLALYGSTHHLRVIDFSPKGRCAFVLEDIVPLWLALEWEYTAPHMP